jgi:malonyl CoA-acyl carrier protein transacylase
MIVIREFFIAKPGQASKLAAMIKDVMSESKDDVRIMTDLTGEFNQVVMETKLTDLAAFEERMKEYSANQAMRDKMKGYTDLWTTGGREIYRLVE